VRVVVRANPSLALTKYWGKLPGGVNLPATSSLAVSLAAFHSATTVTGRRDDPTVARDDVLVNGLPQLPARFEPVIDAIRSRAPNPQPVRIESTNNFPTSAGLASSSSGIAAMVIALDRFFGTALEPSELSGAARLGSGSAARAVYGGFTEWRAGAESAAPVAGSDHWPELRILIAVIQAKPKAVSSRDAMETARVTSPAYGSWVDTAPVLFERARAALLARDLETLGRCMRQSYLHMFSTMFTSEPPLIYWLPESLAVIRCCEELRSRGIDVWETMDAGPQVKLVVGSRDVPAVRKVLSEALPGLDLVESVVGESPSVGTEE